MKTILAKLIWALLLHIRDGDTPSVRAAAEGAAQAWCDEYRQDPQQMQQIAEFL